MLGNLSGGEVVILLLVMLLVFGSQRLPEAGRAVGKGLREFRRALSDARGAVEGGPVASEPPAAHPPKRLID